MIIEQIREDRACALEASDPTGQVCYLATVDADGSPSVRTLVLREVSERSVRSLSMLLVPNGRLSQQTALVRFCFGIPQFKFNIG